MRSPIAVVAALLAVLALALAACGEKEEPVLEPSAPVEITFSKEGGFAGVSQKVRISADDSVFVSQQRSQPLHEADVPPALIAAARNATEGADIGAIDVPPDPGSADAFSYTVSYDGAVVKVSEAVLDDVPEIKPAISAFESILSAAAPAQPAGGGPAA